MKKSIIIFFYCLLALDALTQVTNSPANTFSVDVAPSFFLANGFRLNVGYGKNHLQYGLTSYSHKVFKDVQEITFNISEGFTVERNTAVQAYAIWYPKASRRRFYVGGAISPEWYPISTSENERKVVSTAYAVLKPGLTFFLLKDLLYLDLHVHIKYAFVGTNRNEFRGNAYQVSKFTGIPYWTIGLRIPHINKSK